MLWPLWPSIQTTKTFSISTPRLLAVLLSCHLCVHWSSTFNFLQELFLCIHNLLWHKRPSFQPVSALDMPSSLSLIISNFWFKVIQVGLLLSLEQLEAIVQLLTSLISVSQRIGRPEEREKDGSNWLVE